MSTHARRSPFAPGLRAVTVGSTALVALLAVEYIAVGAAMPTIAEDLDGYALYNLAFGATVATSVVGMVLAGRASDRQGPRPVVLTGAGLFAAGLVLAGLAPSFAFFCLGRAVQGLGTGMLTVALYVVIAQRVEDDVRPAVFSLLAAAWVMPGLVGPLLTGFVVEVFSWHWVFLGVAPLVLVALLVMAPGMRGTGPAADASAFGPATVAWTLVAACAVGVLNLSGDRVSGVEWIVGAGLVTLLAIAARHLLPAGTLRIARGLPATMGARGALGASFVSAESYLPLVLRDEHGWSPAGTGAVLAAASVTWTLGSLLQGRLGPSTDRVRVMWVGTAWYAAFMVLLVAAVAARWSGAWVVGLYGTAVAGVGLAYPTTTLLTLRLSSEAEIGRNSSSLQLGEALGSAFALAATGVVFGLLYRHDAHVAFVATLASSTVVGMLAPACAVRTRA